MKTKTCPDCGNEYQLLNGHLSQTDCEYPSFSERQHEIITGLVMGDASVTKRERQQNPSLTIKSIQKPFLKWFKNQFPNHSGPIKLEATGEENAKEKRESNFSGEAKAENYSDVYRGRINCHPELHQYNDWYGDDGIRYPNNLTLTPLTTKVWYCGDGSLENNHSSRSRCKITCTNESHRPAFLERLFEKCGFDVYVSGKDICFKVDETEQFLEWMGSPIQGYDYKWL